MPIVKVFRTHKSLAFVIPVEFVNAQKIYTGTMFDVEMDGFDRLIFERMQIVRAAPTGSIWTVVKA